MANDKNMFKIDWTENEVARNLFFRNEKKSSATFTIRTGQLHWRNVFFNSCPDDWMSLFHMNFVHIVFYHEISLMYISYFTEFPWLFCKTHRKRFHGGARRSVVHDLVPPGIISCVCRSNSCIFEVGLSLFADHENLNWDHDYSEIKSKLLNSASN